jgi:hypothetical protein
LETGGFSADRRQRSVSGIRVCDCLGEIDRQDDRRAVRRPDHTDIVGGAALARTGLVADTPVFWQMRAHPCVAGLVAEEPLGQLLLRCGRQHVAKHQLLQVAEHCVRRRGVARIARDRLVQRRLDAVEPGHGVA